MEKIAAVDSPPGTHITSKGCNTMFTQAINGPPSWECFL